MPTVTCTWFSNLRNPDVGEEPHENTSIKVRGVEGVTITGSDKESSNAFVQENLSHTPRKRGPPLLHRSANRHARSHAEIADVF